MFLFVGIVTKKNIIWKGIIVYFSKLQKIQTFKQ